MRSWHRSVAQAVREQSAGREREVRERPEQQKSLTQAMAASERQEAAQAVWLS